MGNTRTTGRGFVAINGVLRHVRTRRRRHRTAFFAAIALLAIVFAPSTGRACATAWRNLLDPARTSREDALIVWDEARHTEHFIREAVFDTKAPSFGFLVPVPTRPVLAEADDAIFDALALRTVPKQIGDWNPTPREGFKMTCLPALLQKTAEPMVEGRPSSVRALESQRVAGLDATVLAATDAPALSSWLADHGFAMRDALARWIAVYVAKGWFFVAFRYERGSSDVPRGPSTLASRAARITFTTDRPIYPYREPDDVPVTRGRELVLSILSTKPMEGRLIDGDGGPWPASLRFSEPTPRDDFAPGLLPGLDVSRIRWLARFVDRAETRPASDLVFEPAPHPKPFRPPPLHYTYTTPVYVPVDVVLVALAALVWRWRHRARAASGPTGRGVPMTMAPATTNDSIHSPSRRR